MWSVGKNERRRGENKKRKLRVRKSEKTEFYLASFTVDVLACVHGSFTQPKQRQTRIL